MTIEEILEEEMEEILYIEEEKLKQLKKAKNQVTNDVTSANDDGGENKAHKECVEEEMVANDVTTVRDDENRTKAHKECAEKKIVTNDVTSVSNDNRTNQAHNECAEKELVTKDVTQVCEDGRGNKAHKDCVEEEIVANDVTTIIEDESRKAHKECAEKENVAKDVTLVSNDGRENEAHKECEKDDRVANDVKNINEDKNEKKHDSKKENVIIPPKRTPNDLERRKMIGKMIEIMAVLGMENHVYRFDNVIRKQRSGGPIGLSLTGDIADCYLIGWDKIFIEKLKSLGIDPILYERFKDDITLIVECLEKGSKYENGVIVLDTEKKKIDEEKIDEHVTMEVIVEIAQSIDGMIKFTYDIPDNHKNKKLPVLDVTVNVNKKEENRVDFEFFEKPTRNKKVILENSALPANQKRTILTQECLRRLLNTKIELGEDVRKEHLNNFMLKLKNSGYNTKFRTEILDSALLAYEKIIAADRAGTKPIYRDRDWNKEERNQKKNTRKTNWYKTGDKELEYKSVLFVPITKGGKLLKEMKKREEEINRNSDERIKIVEGGGVKMKDLLVVKNPFPNTVCEMRKCVLCENKTTEIKIACNTNNVGYQLVCETCEDNGFQKIYEGETARSARTRGAEHRRDFNKGKADSAMFKHKQNEHGGEEIKYRMEITKKFRDPLTRQANEAVRITTRKKNEILNSKTEFNHPPVARIIVERSNKFKNKNECGPAQHNL